jgi:U4/U6.U5 tri-snRNP-associated protein 2
LQNLYHADSILGTEWMFCDTIEICWFVQIPLFNILKKFDGETVTEVVRPQLARMKYKITRLPQYIILHMRRFTKNNFFMEKNPTLGEQASTYL